MTRKNFTKTFLSITFAILLPIICLLAIGLTTTKAKGDSDLKYYSEFISLSNSSFNSISSTYASNDVSGWSLINGNTKATTMIIDTEKDYSTNSSKSYYTSTIANPGTKDSDKKILMINSANSKNNPSSKSYKPASANEGYKSSEFTLIKNSYYVLQVSFKTASFSDNASAFASIYLNGLQNDLGQDVRLEYEMISSNSYQTAYFFVSTGAEDQTANLELWLGSEDYESFGVAFFDAVYIQKCSENIFYENYYNDFYSQNNFISNIEGTEFDKNGKKYNYYNTNSSYNNTTRPLVSMCELDKINNDFNDYNLDFEKDNASSITSLVDWTAENQTENANAKVININSIDTFKNTVGSYDYAGPNFKYNNNNALVLWTKDDSGYIDVTSKNIDLKANECLKISAMVKVSNLSGSFNFTVKENDTIINSFPALEGKYTLNSKTVTISANGSDNYSNKYNNATIYVQGHDLYDTSLNLILSLGSASSLAEGCVTVDNVEVERISYEEFSKQEDSLKLNVLTADQSTLSVPNGYFNSAYSNEDKISYPLTAQNWTVEQDSQTDVVSGVINTYEKYYDQLGLTYDWATITNPAKNTSLVNNIYMMHNPSKAYQSITSKDLSLAKDSYYELSFDYKAIQSLASVEANLTVEIMSNDFLIYSATLDARSWDSHKAYFHTDGMTAVTVKFAFGTEVNKCQGYTFIDNVELTSTTKEIFDSAVNKTELTNFMYNIDPTHSVSNLPITASAFTQSGSKGQTGLIKGKNNSSYGYAGNDSIDDGTLNNNVVLLETSAPTTMTLTSKSTMTLDADGYYKLSFRLLTCLPEFSGEEDDDQYGVKVNLSNFDEKSYIISNQGWKKYTIYFHNESTEAIDANLVISLTSIAQANTGYAFVTDIEWAEKNENDETLESEFTDATNDDEFNKTVFTNSYIAKEEDDENAGDDATNNENTTTQTNNNNNENLLTILYAFSAIITGVAIVVAVIGICLKRVKVKKVKKLKPADYDKKIEIDQKIVINEASRIKNAEQTAVEQDMEKLKAEILKLEDEQKARINLTRSNNGKITKDIEREFKSYASKRTKLQDKLNMLNERLSNINSAEYMISLEKRISSQMLKAKKEAQKLARKNSK